MTPLRERTLDVCLDEARHWNGRPVPKERVARYLIGCTRENARTLGNWLVQELLSGKSVSFCAAARGWAEREAAEDGDTLPPWRAGAREIMRDAIAGKRGRWVPAAEARAGFNPPPGSVVVYWRVKPDGWQGHVETLVEASSAGYRSIGANERGGRWYLDLEPVSYDHPRLLGFVVDDEPVTIAIPQTEEVPADMREESMTDADESALLPRQITLEPDWDAVRKERDAFIRASKLDS